MNKALFSALFDSGQWQRMESAIRGGHTPCSVFGLAESQRSHVMAALRLKFKKRLLIVAPDSVRSSQIAHDIEGMTGVTCHVFNPRAVNLHGAVAASRDQEISRITILGKLMQKQAEVIVVPMEAMIQPLAPPYAFCQAMLSINLNDTIEPRKLAERLTWAGYRMEERVESPGQFARRGDILDIYPVGEDNPVRIEFFGDDIDSIRGFDAVSQRSIDSMDQVAILPAVETPLTEQAMERGAKVMKEEARRLQKTKDKATSPVAGYHDSPDDTVEDWVNGLIERLLIGGCFEGMENHIKSFYTSLSTIADYMDDPMVVMAEPVKAKEICDNSVSEYGAMYVEAAQKGRALPSQANLLFDYHDTLLALEKLPMVTLQQMTRSGEISAKTTMQFKGREAAVYRSRFEMLRADVSRWQKLNYRIVLLAGDKGRAKRLQETLSEFNIHGVAIERDRPVSHKEVVILPLSARKGFEYGEAGLMVLTERELFGASRSHSKRRRRKRQGLSVLNDLSVGDFAVHETHGIGRYQGVVALEAGGHTRDYLKIAYNGGDVLYVPTEQMDRVQKYIGTDGASPKVSKLGGSEWARAKGKVKKAVEDMTDELTKLYAQRSGGDGYRFAPDGEWQRQFEDSFPYEETPDQLSCIEEVKEDMQSNKIMDRLLCGDVGYGKTEVALRAVFKAVMDKKQAAILCPTTILAHQHYETMGKRFGEFPVERAELSRFVSGKDAKKVLNGLAAGSVDVVVGTHRLLSDDVRFKDLGLLVVDEEQRFGVKHKEKIKQLKEKVDVLTLSATPIPRTLHMSLSGIRDISILDTPPEERHPVQTFVVEYDENMVRSAILREIGRGGQVFFVYNRVESIEMMANKLRDIVPEARIAVAHGQMKEHKLEKVMVAFLEQEYDVLLCTTIVESGLDIPAVNTLIVYDADRFGLSQLYQLRGRVGRSNRLAYAYLTWQGYKVLNETAEKRLSAISEFTEFGSGLKIAMRDLEIRGAGDLLGARQHGHMASVGYGLYCRIIEDAVRRIKGEAPPPEQLEVTLNLQIDAHIPNDYITDSQDRLDMYRRMAIIQNAEDRSDVIDELIDRFGDPPQAVSNLLRVAYLKMLCQKCGIESIRQSAETFILRFIAEARVDGMTLLQIVQKRQPEIRMSNKDGIVLRYKPRAGGLDALEGIMEEMAGTVGES